MFKFQQFEMKVEVVVQSNLHLPCLLEEGKIARYIAGHGKYNYSLHHFIRKPGIWGNEKGPVNGEAR